MKSRNWLQPHWKMLGAGGLLILGLTLLVYQPVWRGVFLWDDDYNITKSSLIQAPDGLYRFWLTTEAPDYYPLTESLWWFEWRLWGNNPAGYHLVNLLLHVINGWLVWLILRGLRIPQAWFASLVFAIHPVNVATVAWVSEQKNTLAMLFCGISILLYLRFDENRKPRWLGLSLTAFVLALLSKSAVVMLPFVLLGCVWWRHGRCRKEDYTASFPFFVCALILGLVTVWFQHYRVLQGSVVRTEGFLGRWVSAGWLPWFYFFKAILPVNLNVIYPKWGIDCTRLIDYLPGIGLVGGLILFWVKRKTWGRPCFFAVGSMVIMLFPVLGFIDQGFYSYSLVADHWQYFSISAIIALLVAATATHCPPPTARRRWIQGIAGLVLIIALGWATEKRAGLYANREALWRDTLAKNPAAWVAWNELGLALLEGNRIPEAIAGFESSVRIHGRNNPAHKHLGLAYARVGETQTAILHFEQALRINPNEASTLNNYGNLRLAMGDTVAAITLYQQALQIDPTYGPAYNNWGHVLMQQGAVLPAITLYEKALQINPEFAEAHHNLGNALLRMGKSKAAIAQYEVALRINPSLAGASNHLAAALSKAHCEHPQ